MCACLVSFQIFIDENRCSTPSQRGKLVISKGKQHHHGGEKHATSIYELVQFGLHIHAGKDVEISAPQMEDSWRTSGMHRCNIGRRVSVLKFTSCAYTALDTSFCKAEKKDGKFVSHMEPEKRARSHFS